MLMAATALLYFGPLLAGLGGFGWAVVPVFAAIFLLWLVIVRPQDFPRTLADWAGPEALIGFAARAAMQVLLVLVCFGLGRGIGGVLGSVPTLPLMLPIAISFLSIPLARLVWDPWKAQAMDHLLADALAQIENGAATGAGRERAYAETVTLPLNGLAHDVSEADLERHLSGLRALVDETAIFDVLLARVKAGVASVAGKRALMLMGSNAAIVERMARPDVPVCVMQALGSEPEIIARMAERLIIALRQDPDIWADCPNLGFLEGLRVQLPTAESAILALQAEIKAQAPHD
ncbi:hypothetical protein [Pseudorhodobacter sp.]